MAPASDKGLCDRSALGRFGRYHRDRGAGGLRGQSRQCGHDGHREGLVWTRSAQCIGDDRGDLSPEQLPTPVETLANHVLGKFQIGGHVANRLPTAIEQHHGLAILGRDLLQGGPHCFLLLLADQPL